MVVRGLAGDRGWEIFEEKHAKRAKGSLSSLLLMLPKPAPF
jgi:hypothetical protein